MKLDAINKIYIRYIPKTGFINGPGRFEFNAKTFDGLCKCFLPGALEGSGGGGGGAGLGNVAEFAALGGNSINIFTGDGGKKGLGDFIKERKQQQLQAKMQRKRQRKEFSKFRKRQREKAAAWEGSDDEEGAGNPGSPRGNDEDFFGFKFDEFKFDGDGFRVYDDDDDGDEDDGDDEDLDDEDYADLDEGEDLDATKLVVKDEEEVIASLDCLVVKKIDERFGLLKKWNDRQCQKCQNDDNINNNTKSSSSYRKHGGHGASIGGADRGTNHDTTNTSSSCDFVRSYFIK